MDSVCPVLSIKNNSVNYPRVWCAPKRACIMRVCFGARCHQNYVRAYTSKARGTGRRKETERERPTGACKRDVQGMYVRLWATLGSSFILNGVWHDLVRSGRKMRGRRVLGILVEIQENSENAWNLRKMLIGLLGNWFWVKISSVVTFHKMVINLKLMEKWKWIQINCFNWIQTENSYEWTKWIEVYWIYE